MRPRHLSPFQFEQQPDGSMGLADFAALTLNTIEGQGHVTGRNWQSELALPEFFEQWEAMATPRSDAHRGRMTAALFDEAPTRLVGHPKMQPKQIVLPTACPLELGHSGFVVGGVYGFVLGVEAMRGAVPALLNLTLPAELEGDYILGQATFFDSLLAKKAQEGIQRNIFTHVCPVVWSTEGASPGTGLLVQVSLVCGDFPGCPNSRILNWST